MEKLSYKTLKKLHYDRYLLESAPERVLQFGEGNFLRAFVNYWFDMANEKVGWNGKCVLVQPIAPGLAKLINEQDGLYTLYLRGRENGEKVDRKRVISSVSRCLNPYEKADYEEMMKVAVSDDLEYVVSNTTEAGIVYDPSCQKDDCPASSFPGKLTQVLYKRWQAGKGGLVILSCELIDNNGKELKKCVDQYVGQWKLEPAFTEWLGTCTFCSTLVDRIVPGRIRDPEEVARIEQENGYHDELIDVGEVFGVWNIEGPEWLEEKLPFKAAGLNCPVVPDVTPYKKRKVRILNGAHTGFVLGAYLAGFDIVRDCMQDRFNNPFVNHELMSISLNSTSKWRARNMPSFLEYIEKTGKLPACLTMSFACYIAFFSNDIQELNDKGLVCRRPKGNDYVANDDRWALEFYAAHKDDSVEDLVHAVMTNEQMWGQDLTRIAGFEDAVVKGLHMVRGQGAKAAMQSCL